MRMSQPPVAVSSATFHLHQYSQHYRADPGTHVLACLQNVQRSHLTQTTKRTYSTLELQSSALHHPCRVNVIPSMVYRVNENAYKSVRLYNGVFYCQNVIRLQGTRVNVISFSPSENCGLSCANLTATHK